MDAIAKYRAQLVIVDLIKQLAAPVVQRCPECRPYRWIHAIRPCQSEDRTGTFLRAGSRQRQHPTKELSVVAHLHAAVAFEGVHVDAELLYNLDVSLQV